MLRIWGRTNSINVQKVLWCLAEIGIDMSRFARENRDPAEYLSLSYYQLWFAALETMLKQRDLVAALFEQGLHMFRLPQGQAAFARGNHQLAQSRNLFVMLGEYPMLACALPKK